MRDLSLELRQGEIVALLGNNGAGALHDNSTTLYSTLIAVQ